MLGAAGANLYIPSKVSAVSMPHFIKIMEKNCRGACPQPCAQPGWLYPAPGPAAPHPRQEATWVPGETIPFLHRDISERLLRSPACIMFSGRHFKLQVLWPNLPGSKRHTHSTHSLWCGGPWGGATSKECPALPSRLAGSQTNGGTSYHHASKRSSFVKTVC